jgi:ABC-type multidrug transport system fused ATPase/permease subunit
VLEDGCLIDSGTHGDLITTCPLYADIVERQKLAEQLEKLR